MTLQIQLLKTIIITRNNNPRKILYTLPDMTVLVATDLHQNLHAEQCCRNPDSSLKQTSDIKMFETIASAVKCSEKLKHTFTSQWGS